MTHRSIVTGVLLIATAALSTGNAQQQLGAQSPPGSLKWHAAHAKATGQTTLSIGADKEGYDYTPRLAEILKNSLLIHGRVKAVSVDDSDGFHIWTWYRVQPVRKGRLPLKINHDAVSPHVPLKVPPAKDSEVLIRVLGGTATVDGVSIVESGPAQLSVGQEYLFCLERTDTGFYSLAFGTKPIVLDSTGKMLIADKDKSKFAGYLRPYKSFGDVLTYSTRLK